MKQFDEPGEESNKIGASLRSMVFSLLLVIFSLAFVFGFKYYLAGQTYHGPQIAAHADEEDTANENEDTLELDKTFDGCYLMIKNVSSKGLKTTSLSNKEEKSSDELSNGQILKAEERGIYREKTYYHLKDGKYLEASDNVEELSGYTELNGYLAITYISSSGVKLRSWADFKADNIVGAVYVGDKVPVAAKVITKGGVSAYLTEEGAYITTDTRYLNDYTSVPEEKTDADKTDTGTSEKEARE